MYGNRTAYQTFCLDFLSMPARPYRTRSRPSRSEKTRAHITATVRELLAEGTFHESTMEEIADRAGIARATLYQHFRSRLELVDSICGAFAENPALLELKQTLGLPDSDAALAGTIANSVRFWSSEDAVLRQLYGVAAVDQAAQDLVDRQRADRRQELERLVRNLRSSGRLRAGTTERRALTLLLVLTGYDTFRELKEAGLSDRRATTLLQETAAELLLQSP